jgi:recombination associated protein RdgC
MSVLKGVITYTKYQVEGVMPDDHHQKFMARIRTREFRALTPEDADDISVGWVPIERPYDEEISFRTEGVFFVSYLNLGLRIDRWKFPAALIKAKVTSAETAYRAKTGKERISKAEKKELRDMVERKLRRDGVPVTKVVDFTWNMDSREVRVFGASSSVLEHFYELFEKTFQPLKLVPSTPYTVGLTVGLPGSLVKALKIVEPCSLRSGGAS